MITDTLVIIPARGGSKGIPGKNIRPLAGNHSYSTPSTSPGNCSPTPT